MAIQSSTTITVLTAQQRDAGGQKGNDLPPFQPCSQNDLTCNHDALKVMLDAVNHDSKVHTCIRASTFGEHSCF